MRRARRTIAATDAEAIASDWSVVGNDLQEAFDQYIAERRAEAEKLVRGRDYRRRMRRLGFTVTP